jgi:hypothetical protein
MAISNYDFNLHSMAGVCDVLINLGSTSLRPKAITSGNTIKDAPPTPPVQLQTVPAFELTGFPRTILQYIIYP